MPDLAPIPMLLFHLIFSALFGGGRTLRNQHIGPIGPAYPSIFTRDRHAWVRGPPARMPSLPREMPLGRQPSRPAAPPPPGNGPAKVRQKSGPEARAPREARLTCRGRFASHPVEPCRRRTSIDSGRGVGNGFTAPTRRRIPAQGETLCIRGNTSQAF